MKLCSACYQTLPKESFSKRQWSLNQQQRKCRGCIGESSDANQVVQLKAPPKIDSTEKRTEKQPPPCVEDDEDASCWICLEAGSGDGGQPLRRDCSCRGTDAGYVHLSCIVEYAKQKSKQWDGCDGNELCLDEFVKPWELCPGCHQTYQNELALDLATEFVTFVEETYPDDNDIIHLEALTVKLCALDDLPSQRENTKQVANTMLSVIGQMRTETPSLAQDVVIRSMEAIVYSTLGCIAAEEGTKESGMAAVGHFEKQRDINKAIGNRGGLRTAEANIVYAMSKCEEGAGISIDEMLKLSQESYKSSAKHYGQVDTTTIDAGVNLAIALKNTARGIKADRLLTRLASTSKRVHGSDHQLTQKVESYLQGFKVRLVMINFGGEAKLTQALCYTEDGKKCIVQGPIENPRSIQDEGKFKVDSKYVKFTCGTPVVCHGLDPSSHLNGKIGDLREDEETVYYKVHFEDKELEPCRVELDNIRIVFELPDEL